MTDYIMNKLPKFDDNYGFSEVKKETKAQDDSLLKLFPVPVYSVQLNGDDFLEEENFLKKVFMKNSKDVDYKGVILRTDFTTNYFYLNYPEVVRMKEAFQKYLQIFMNNVMGITGTATITFSWLNLLTKDRTIPAHTHSNSIITGVYYFQVPDNTSITFHKTMNYSSPQFELDPVTRCRDYFSSSECAFQTVSIPIKRGMLLLFPANLSHSVKRVDSDDLRWSLGFDSVPIELLKGLFSI